MKKELGIFVLLVVLILATTFVDPNRAFIRPENLSNLALLIGMFGIFSIGLGIVIITGGIDLSVGSMFALLGVFLSIMLSDWHFPWLVAVLLTIAGGAVMGLLHGLLITRVNLQPFVVTLCGLLFYRGAARYIAHDESRGFNNSDVLKKIATGEVAGIPVAFVILLVVAVIMAIMLHRSVYGRYLYAVGRNEDAARYSGINTRKVVTSAYIISGGLSGLAAILIAFYATSVAPSQHGSFYELYGIAAAVLGGCSLRGGEGSILGILLGTALLQVLQNLVNLLGIPSSLNFAVMGSVILLGVIADQLIKSRGQTRKA